MDLISFRGKNYPAFQAEGNAAQFTIPFAKKFCIGTGYDIGCAKEEWAFPGALPIDPVLDDKYDAMNLPDGKVDYIFSSHCLEHLDSWIDAIKYWTTKIRSGGILYLYLPSYEQEYWRPWNNTKHKHVLDADTIIGLLNHNGYKNVMVSRLDLNHSFTIVGEVV